MTPPNNGMVLGVDIGFSKKRKTTVLAMLCWRDGQVGMAWWPFPAAPAERRKLLGRILAGETAMCVALDGPIRGDMTTIREYRRAEMMLTRGLAEHIGKPGQSSSGNGIRLNEATNEVARFLLGEGFIADATHEAQIMDKAIVEAFPTSYLGVMLDKKRIPKHGARSDAYFEHLLGPDSPRPRVPHGNMLADLIQRLLPGHVLMSDLAQVTDHDARAAIVCAITALCVVVKQYVAVGDPTNGSIILPPRGSKGRPGLQDWAWKIIQANLPRGSTDAIITEPSDDHNDVQEIKQETPYQIDYMPWAGLNAEFSIGPVSFWPFQGKASEKIADVEVREYLTIIFRSYVDHYGKPANSIVICSIGDLDFRQLAEKEQDLIRAAVDSLVFTTICNGTRNGVAANNNSMGPPTADRYALYTRNFTVGRQSFSVNFGGTTHLFSQSDEVCIPKPFSTGGLFGRVDADDIEAYTKVCDGNCPSDVRKRLLRAFEWFRLAHTETDIGAVTWLNRVMMMCTAFEILLDFPESKKRRYFIDQVDAQLRMQDSLTVMLPDGHGGTFEVCKAAEWAGQFYKLRNDITHGDQVPYERIQYKDWITHLIVADLVMLELVERMLYEHGCIGDKWEQMAAELSMGSPKQGDGLSLFLS